MRQDLNQRTIAFAKSIEDAHFLEKVRLIERFLVNELDARETPYTLTKNDLYLIHDYTAKLSIDLSLNPKDSMELAALWALSVTNLLRSRNLLQYIIGVDKKEMIHEKKANLNND